MQTARTIFEVYPEATESFSRIEWVSNADDLVYGMRVTNEFLVEFRGNPDFIRMLDELHAQHIANQIPAETFEQPTSQAILRDYGLTRDEEGYLDVITDPSETDLYNAQSEYVWDEEVDVDTYTDLDEPSQSSQDDHYDPFGDMWIVAGRARPYNCNICFNTGVRMNRSACTHYMCMTCVISSYEINRVIAPCPYCGI